MRYSARSKNALTLANAKCIIRSTQPPRLLIMRNLGGFLLPIEGISAS